MSTQTPLIVDSSRFTGVSGIRDYEVLGKLGEGTFGEVHKAQSKKTKAIVALKKILMHNEKDGFPITALREIKIMKLLSHTNVLRLEDMAIERPQSKGKEKLKAIIYMVTPYMDHDLSGMLENPRVEFKEPQIKCYLQQLLEGVRFLHNSHILHRDMKAANLLINNKGLLQIADFGLARHYDEPIPREGCGCGEARRDYTSLVVTRWYRPPELLLQLRKYTPAVDMWGVGCVFGEMFKRSPILMGKSDINQASIIFDLMGSPTEDNMPGWDKLPGVDPPNKPSWTARPGRLKTEFAMMGEQGLDLMSKLMRLDWRRRINAIDALKHPYFKTAPLPARREELPTYEDSHELDRRRFKDQRAAAGALPPAPAGGTVGGGPNGDFMEAPPPYQSRPSSRDPRANERLPPRDGYRQGPVGSGPREGGRVPGGRAPTSSDDRQPRRGWERHPNAPRLRPGEPISNGAMPRRSNVDTYIPEHRKDDAGRPRRDDGLPSRREEVLPRRENGPPPPVDSYVPPSRDDRSRDDRSWHDRDGRGPRDDRTAPPVYRDDRREDRRDDRREDRDRDYRRDYRDRDDGGYSRNRDREYPDRDRRPRERDDSDRDRRFTNDRQSGSSAQRRTRSRSPMRSGPQDMSHHR